MSAGHQVGHATCKKSWSDHLQRFMGISVTEPAEPRTTIV